MSHRDPIENLRRALDELDRAVTWLHEQAGLYTPSMAARGTVRDGIDGTIVRARAFTQRALDGLKDASQLHNNGWCDVAADALREGRVGDAAGLIWENEPGHFWGYPAQSAKLK